jgi:hypothetical protein
MTNCPHFGYPRLNVFMGPPGHVIATYKAFWLWYSFNNIILKQNCDPLTLSNVLDRRNDARK